MNSGEIDGKFTIRFLRMPGCKGWRRLLMGIVATALVAGCTVQLTAPYSSDIDIAGQRPAVRLLPVRGGDADGRRHTEWLLRRARLPICRLRSAPGGDPDAFGEPERRRSLRPCVGGDKKAQLPLGIRSRSRSPQRPRRRGQTTPAASRSWCGSPRTTWSGCEASTSCDAIDRRSWRCTTLFSAPPIFNILSPGQSDAPLRRCSRHQPQRTRWR